MTAFAQRLILHPEERDHRPLLAIAIGAVTLFFALALTRGAVAPVMGLLGVVTIVAAMAYPRFGLYATVSLGVLGDLRIGDPNVPLLKDVFVSLSGLSVTPFEILMVFSTLGLVTRLLFDDTVHLHMGELALAIGALLLAILLGAGVGIARGADSVALRAEIRGFFYLPMVYLLVVHFVTSRREWERLMWVFVALVNVAAVEEIYRYYAHVRGEFTLDSAVDLAFQHEDALYCAAAVIFLIARVIWSEKIWEEWKSIMLLILPLTALIVMKRRAGMVALDGGLILLCVVLLKDNFKLFLAAVPMAAVGMGLLLAVTWNNPGGSGQFARSFQSITGQESTARDQASDDYRRIETADVRLNVHDNPIFGLGFGRPYVFYLPLPDLSRFWALYPYVSHNSVMWVWMKAGILGFLTLIALFAAALIRSSQLVQTIPKGRLKGLAFSMGAIVLMFILYSWVDLGLVSARALLLFGVALGGIASISRIVATPASQDTTGEAAARV